MTAVTLLRGLLLSLLRLLDRSSPPRVPRMCGESRGSSLPVLVDMWMPGGHLHVCHLVGGHEQHRCDRCRLKWSNTASPSIDRLA